LADALPETPDGRPTARAMVGEAAARFYFPEGTRWDVTLDHYFFPTPRVPTPDEFSAKDTEPVDSGSQAALKTEIGKLVPGSNGWVVDGTVSATGAALVANDTHLTLDSIPGIYYRISLNWREDGDERSAVGASIPGLPSLVMGSNGSIAWGFTAGRADVTDIINLELDPQNPRRYRTPEGWRDIERREERFMVSGRTLTAEEVEASIWGPLLPPEPGRPRQAVKSVLHDPQAMNLNFFKLMDVPPPNRSSLSSGTVSCPRSPNLWQRGLPFGKTRQPACARSWPASSGSGPARSLC